MTTNKDCLKSVQLSMALRWLVCLVCLQLAYGQEKESDPLDSLTTLRPSSLSKPTFSYLRTVDLVKGMIQDVKRPEHSWAVSWADLIDSESAQLGSKAHGIVQAAKLTAGAQLREFIGCMQAARDDSSALSFGDISKGAVPNVKLLATWWHSEAAPSMQATLVTFGSIERLYQLRAQCLAWPGPLSAVVYIPVLQKAPGPVEDANREALRRAVLRFMYMVTDLERRGNACQLSLSLVYEIVRDDNILPLYPLNTLRNLARAQACTPIVAMLDVDLIPSKSLHTRLSDEEQADAMLSEMESHKKVYIVPAFELTPAYDTLAWADVLASAPNKEVMRRLVEIPVVVQFHAYFYKGHRLSNYTQWCSDDATYDYPATYEDSCEPWVVGPAKLLPWSDERYRGYGNDKIQLINNINGTGFQFMVLHDAYIIHRPHSKCAAAGRFADSRRRKSQSAHTPFQRLLDEMYKEQARKFAVGEKWQASVSTPLQTCISKLSWWTDPNAMQPPVSSTPTIRSQHFTIT